MARETIVTIKDWCDFHLVDDDKKIEGSFTDTFTIGKLTRRLSLCPEHEEQGVPLGQLREILTRYGSTAESELAAGPLRPAARRKAEEVADQHFCPLEDCERHVRPYGSRTGLSGHVRTVHGITLKELTTGKARAPKARQASPPPVLDEVFPCTLCGETSLSPAGRGSHMRSKHGVMGAKRAKAEAQPA